VAASSGRPGRRLRSTVSGAPGTSGPAAISGLGYRRRMLGGRIKGVRVHMEISKVDLLVADVGDVLVTTRSGRHYAALARLAKLSPRDVADRFESAGINAAFDCGSLSAREFTESISDLLGRELGIEAVKHAWRAVIGPVDAEIAGAVLPLVRQGRLLLASNTDAIHWPVARSRLAAAGIVAPAALSFELGTTKPSPDFFEAVTRMYLNVPGHAGYIDDQVINVEAACKAGLRGIVHTTVASTVQWIRSCVGPGKATAERF
jgi:FMN phosphatase YigB (HAD superfamily)